MKGWVLGLLLADQMVRRKERKKAAMTGFLSAVLKVDLWGERRVVRKD